MIAHMPPKEILSKLELHGYFMRDAFRAIELGYSDEMIENLHPETRLLIAKLKEEN